MEELMQMRNLLLSGRYPEALELLAELEEMSKDDKINKIDSFLQILLIHLIKQHSEKRTTRSWDVSIRNAVANIEKVNRRKKAGGHYLTDEEMKETIADAFPSALSYASLEAFEGTHSEEELAAMIDAEKIKAEAFEKVMASHQ